MDLLLSLLLIPFAVPLALGFVTMCCCGATCDKCSGTPPAQYQIVFATITNSSCTDCGECNGTWTVDGPIGGVGVGSCFWRYEDSAASFCSSTGMLLQVEQGVAGGNYFTRACCAAWNIFSTAYVCTGTFQLNHGASPGDCAASALSLPAATDQICNYLTSGTCEITSL